MYSEDDLADTPPVVIASVALGVAPVPFALTYAAIFISHGTIFPVDPPDITGSRLGEATWGFVTFGYMVLVIASIGWLLARMRRWPFVIGQAVALGISLDFLIDSTKGSPQVPVVILATSFCATVMAMLPSTWRWVRDWRYDPELVGEIPEPTIRAGFRRLAPRRRHAEELHSADDETGVLDTFADH